MIQIDIDTDLMLVNGEDRYPGACPPTRAVCTSAVSRSPAVPAVARGALIEEITDTVVYFRAIEATEPRK